FLSETNLFNSFACAHDQVGTHRYAQLHLEAACQLQRLVVPARAESLRRQRHRNEQRGEFATISPYSARQQVTEHASLDYGALILECTYQMVDGIGVAIRGDGGIETRRTLQTQPAA